MELTGYAKCKIGDLKSIHSVTINKASACSKTYIH